MRVQLSHYQRRIIAELRRNNQQSYDTLAAQIGCHRNTVLTDIRQLEARQLVVKERGTGTRPNRYYLAVD
jgi:DNA-binding Lrp family transcriptional regulator